MCKICSKARKLDTGSALIVIGEAIAEAKTLKEEDHLSDLLDEILGIENSDVEEDLDEIWERRNRETH